MRHLRQPPSQATAVDNQVEEGADLQNTAGPLHQDRQQNLLGNERVQELRRGTALRVGFTAPKDVVFDNTLDLTAATEYALALDHALRSAGPNELGGADGALRELLRISGAIRDGVATLMRESSVTNANRDGDPRLPAKDEVGSWNAAIRSLRAQRSTLSDATLDPALDVATAAGADAALACFGALAALQGRASWRTNQHEPSPDEVRAGTLDPEVRAVHEGAGARPGIKVQEGSGNEEVADWCGYFVMSNLVRGAGLDGEHKGSTNHTNHGLAFFSYNAVKPNRKEPAWVWAAEAGRWMPVRAYHELRGSVRKMWTAQTGDYVGKYDDVQDVLKSGIRAGDVVIRDTPEPGKGYDGKGNHYGMAESAPGEDGALTTLEGNFMGIRADAATGGVERGRNGDIRHGEYARLGNGSNRRRDGFAAVMHDTRADTAASRARDFQGHGSEAGAHIRIVGRPSVCDFEKHEYSSVKPKDLTKRPG